MSGRTMAIAALMAGVATGTARAQLHSADMLVRVQADALEPGVVGQGGTAVYPVRIKSALFGAEGFANFTNDPGVNSESGALLPGMALGFDLVGALREWDGEDFDTISDDTVTVRDGGLTVATTPPTDTVVLGDIFGQAGQSASAIFHSHVQWFLNYPSSTPVSGVWLVSWRLWTDEPGIDPTQTLYIVFGQGAAAAQVDDAVAWVEANLLADACPADMDGNGTLNLDDIDLFVVAFVGGDLAADLDGSGTLNLDDIDAFVASFLSGCP